MLRLGRERFCADAVGVFDGFDWNASAGAVKLVWFGLVWFGLVSFVIRVYCTGTLLTTTD